MKKPQVRRGREMTLQEVKKRTYLVSHDGFFYSGEGFERGQKDVSVWRTTNVVHEVAEFLGEGKQHFVFIVNGFCIMERQGL